MAIMCRDEEVNFKLNLEKWTKVIGYFIFLIDDRTTDNSVQTIKDILDSAGKKYKIQNYLFTGFGQARTLSLDLTWKTFPQASHVLIADPDWSAELNTIDLTELDFEHDVFRFTAYDRNGVTRRKMDWLLRNKPNLRMRYHLHEVLDIGLYTVKQINWVVHEIEKPGTWHTTVGHGNSMSAKRLLFDLTLLKKDLTLYHHDPHVHYYLGITEYAYVEAMFKESRSGLTDELLNHLNESVEFLKLRLTSRYEAEFVEERWASMFILGGIYVHYLKDYVNGRLWYSLCRDYNPQQFECGMQLTRLHVLQGQLDDALVEVEKMLKTEKKERMMLNYIQSYECDLPLVVVDVLDKKLNFGQGSVDEMKYLLLLVKMTSRDLCAGKEITLSQNSLNLISKSLKFDKGGNLQTTSTQNELCADNGLQLYLRRNKYLLHPCTEVQHIMEITKQCELFVSDLPPAYEEFQAGSSVGRFIGAAIPPDIIHLVYGGDRREIYGKNENNIYRVLFAEYFEPEMIYNLLGVFQREKFGFYEIIIVSEDIEKINLIKENINYCGQKLEIKFGKVVYKTLSLKDYLNTTVKSLKTKGVKTQLFDYIEYNGGISISDQYSTQLSNFNLLLKPKKGVIGLTYFSSNQHVKTIRTLLQQRNPNTFVPFSVEASRFIKTYLELHNLKSLSKDPQLIAFLGGEAVETGFVATDESILIDNRVNWRGWTQNEVLNMLEEVGFRVLSWVPTAYSRPFEEIDHYEVKKFWALGLSQEDFIEQKMINFRYTLYISSLEDLNYPVGRPVIKGNMTKNPDLIRVIDRLGSLSLSLAGIEEKGENLIPSTVTFAHQSLFGGFPLNHVLSPFISPCVPLLSQKPTLGELHRINVVENKKRKIKQQESELWEGLIGFLRFLEGLNVITLESNSSVIEFENFNFYSRSYKSSDLLIEEKVKNMKNTKEIKKNDQNIELQKNDSNMNKNNEMSESTKKINSLTEEEQKQRMIDLGFSDEFIKEETEFQNSQKEKSENIIENQRLNEMNSEKDNSLGGKLKGILETLRTVDKVIEEKTLLDGSLDKSFEGEEGLIGLNQGIGGSLKDKENEINEKNKENNELINKKELKDGFNLDSILNEMRLIELPNNIQNSEMLKSSYRKVECFLREKRGAPLNNDCLQKMEKRKTLGLSVTSSRKISFDLNQLKYIQSTLLNISSQTEEDRKNLLNTFITPLEKISEYCKTELTHSIANNPFDNIRANEHKKIKNESKAINRLITIQENENHNQLYLQKGLIRHLKGLRDHLESSDFLVIDQVLHADVIDQLSSILLKSTIWFDVTNGAAFCSHHDHGLVHHQFQFLSQQIAYLFSEPEEKLRVVKYFTLAMDLTKSGFSPVVLGKKDEIVVILWLNPTSMTSEQQRKQEEQNNEDPSIMHHNDGLRIFDEFSLNILYTQGVSVYPSVHSDFLSKNGNLTIDILERCGKKDSELVLRRPNRMVVVRARRPVLLFTPNYLGWEIDKKPENFVNSTMIALVLFLSK